MDVCSYGIIGVGDNETNTDNLALNAKLVMLELNKQFPAPYLGMSLWPTGQG